MQIAMSAQFACSCLRKLRAKANLRTVSINLALESIRISRRVWQKERY